jgi:hypothetical protein
MENVRIALSSPKQSPSIYLWITKKNFDEIAPMIKNRVGEAVMSPILFIQFSSYFIVSEFSTE